LDRRYKLFPTLLFFFSFANPVAAECIPYTEALKHIGENRCVSGKVVQVKPGAKGIHYLDFCVDYRTCTFTAVVFRGDLKHVGDVRQLEGRVVEIHGDIKLYDERAEIVLHDASQLGGAAIHVPPLPKDYDVERKGHYSAGSFSHPQTSSGSSTKKRQPATIPALIPNDPSE
jgi:hypothetical protein